jgi:hypothetical protein
VLAELVGVFLIAQANARTLPKESSLLTTRVQQAVAPLSRASHSRPVLEMESK